MLTFLNSLLEQGAHILMPLPSKIKTNILLLLLELLTPTMIFAEIPSEGLISPQEYITKIFNSPAGSLEIHSWDRYVRKFRRDHHLAVTTGWDQGSWHIGSLGKISDQDFKSAGVDSTVLYTFHIQLEGKFGYYLGTSAGYYTEQIGSRNDEFTPSSMWKLPGVVGGFVYNYDPTGRFKVGTIGYLARLNNLRTRINDESQQLALSAECFEITAGWDAFLTLNWGVQLQWHNRQMWVPKPDNAGGSILDAHLNRASQGLTLGSVYHFL